MANDRISMTLLLDENMVVTDAPCSDATLISQYTDGLFALTITAEGTCVLGFDGEQHISVNIRDLVDLLLNGRCDGSERTGSTPVGFCLH
jgi:hypothetical protein